ITVPVGTGVGLNAVGAVAQDAVSQRDIADRGRVGIVGIDGTRSDAGRHAEALSVLGTGRGILEDTSVADEAVDALELKIILQREETAYGAVLHPGERLGKAGARNGHVGSDDIRNQCYVAAPHPVDRTALDPVVVAENFSGRVQGFENVRLGAGNGTDLLGVTVGDTAPGAIEK